MLTPIYSAGEQFAGIIVCCLPILPAFYRHIKTHNRSSHDDSGPLPQSPGGLSQKLTNSFLGGRHRGAEGPKALAAAQLKEPFPLYSSRGYEELDEIEAQMGGRRIVRRTDISVTVESRAGGNQLGVVVS